jgi:thioredoxin reductase (NADPH)
MQDRAYSNDKLKFVWNSEVTDIVGDTEVTGLQLSSTLDGSVSELAVSGLFVAIGHDPRSELVKGQVDLDDEGYVLVSPHGTQTNVAGVFACGDLVDHTYRQAITAAGTGCAAALDAERYLTEHVS